MSMTDVSIATVSELLEATILKKDLVKTLAIVLELKEKLRGDPVAVKWITEPSNIKNLQEMLTEHLEIPAKLMMLKNKMPNRQKRAHMFVQAMENGLRRVLDE